MLVFGEEFIDRIDAIKTELPTVKHFICAAAEVPSYRGAIFQGMLTSRPPTPTHVEIGFDDPCGLYFTSGTTGQPKPILLTHKNMMNACITEKMHHYQTRDDNFILIPPLYHTGAKMHWFGSLIVGGRAVILKGATPETILEAVSEESGHDRLAPRAVGAGHTPQT